MKKIIHNKELLDVSKYYHQIEEERDIYIYILIDFY